MKKFITAIVFILFLATIVYAKTVQEYLGEGYTLKDMEKGFIECSMSFYNSAVPESFPNSLWCNGQGQCPRQMTWAEYCAGSIKTKVVPPKMILVLDRCGYPNGQNRAYPPEESVIDLFLNYYGEDKFLSEIPGRVKWFNYPEEGQMPP